MPKSAPRRELRLLATVAGASILFAAPAAHATTFMDTFKSVSKTYNLFLSGDLGKADAPLSYSDTEGKVAVGGSAYLKGYEVGQKNPGGDALVVGKALNYQSGTIHGNVVVGGAASFPTNQGGTTVEGTVAAGAGLGVSPTQYSGTATFSSLPLDFGQVGADLASASSFLNSADARGQGTLGQAAKTPWGQLNLTSAAGGVVFFDLAASDLVGINALTFSVDPKATIIINLTGQTGGLLTNYGFLGNVQKELTLFNFIDAENLNMANLGFMGSILAPKADVVGTYGQINGSVMAESFNGTTQINWAGFNGGLPTHSPPVITPPTIDPPTPGGPIGAVPEPSSWVTMILGVAALGAVLRRRRHSANAQAAI